MEDICASTKGNRIAFHIYLFVNVFASFYEYVYIYTYIYK